MVYKAFLETILTSLKKRFGPHCTLTLRQVRKNNGIVLDGLCIQQEGESAVPTIYLNGYYEEYQQARTLEDILDDICRIYSHSNIPAIQHLEQFFTTESVQQHITYRVVHAESNQELLKQIPHVLFLDLAIVFYLFLDLTDNQPVSSLIYKEYCSTWDLSLSQLIALADENTPRLLPPSITSLEEVLNEMAEKQTSSKADQISWKQIQDLPDQKPPLYVLSNQYGVHGAGCFLYNDVLKNFASSINSDLVILPSSIHEVLLLPDHKDADYEELHQLVTEVNQDEVPFEDRLSNQIYHYSRNTNSVTMVTNSVSPLETWNP